MSYGRIRRGRMAADAIGKYFTQVSNLALRDKRLSRRARGLLSELLTHADGFGISVTSLVASGPEGKDAITTALKELERHGYLVRTRQRDAKGQLGDAVYEVTDMPEGSPGLAEMLGLAETPRSEPMAENPQQADEPMADFPAQGNPALGNPPHKKTTFEEDHAFAPQASSAKPEDHLPQTPSASAGDQRPGPENSEGADAPRACGAEEEGSPGGDELRRATANLPKRHRDSILRAAKRSKDLLAARSTPPAGPAQPAPVPSQKRAAPPAPPSPERFLMALPRVGPKTAASLAPLVTAAFTGGWSPDMLAKHLRAGYNPERSRNPGGVLRTLLEDLPAPPRTTTLLPWCGRCGDGLMNPDPPRRWFYPDDGPPRKCDECHPGGARARSMRADM